MPIIFIYIYVNAAFFAGSHTSLRRPPQTACCFKSSSMPRWPWSLPDINEICFGMHQMHPYAAIRAQLTRFDNSCDAETVHNLKLTE